MTGRKVWVADEVLSAADLNEYLVDQVVTIFNSAAARDAAMLTPIEGQLVYLQDTNVYQSWNGSAWVGLNSTYTSGVKIFTGASTPTADPNASVNLWFN